jgi:hypothetical protein
MDKFMVHGKKERKENNIIIIIIIITRYDYNLMIMKSPKPATDTMGKLKFRTLMLITYKWIMIET